MFQSSLSAPVLSWLTVYLSLASTISSGWGWERHGGECWAPARELWSGWGGQGNKKIPIFKALETLRAPILNGFPCVKAVHIVAEPRVWATVVIFLAQWRGYLQRPHLNCPQVSTGIPCMCPQSIGSFLPSTGTLRSVGSIKIINIPSYKCHWETVVHGLSSLFVSEEYEYV